MSSNHEGYSLGIDVDFSQLEKANKATSALYQALGKVNQHFSGMHAPNGLPSQINHISAVTASYIQRLESEGKTYQANQERVKGYKSAISELTSKQKGLESQLAKIAKTSGTASAAYQRQQVRINQNVTEMNKFKTAIESTNSEMNKLHPTGLNRIVAATKKIDNATNTMKSKLHSAWDNIKSGATVATGAIAGVTAATVSGAKRAGDLQQSYREINNLATLGGEKQKEVTKSVMQMQSQGRDMSIKYGKSQQEIAEGYEDLVKRGYSTKQALGAMQTELQASVASGDKFSDVTTVSSQVLDSFGMRANNTAKMIKNTRKAVNELAYSADATSTGFSDIGIGMSYVGAAAKAANVSLAETASSMGILSNNGLESDKAGTGLRSTLNGLANAVNKIGTKKSILTKLGINKSDMVDAHGHMKSLSTDMSVLYDHIKSHSSSSIEEQGFFKSIFGTTGQQAAIILAKNTSELKELTKRTAEAGNKSNYVAKLSAKNGQTAKMQLAKAKQAVAAFQIEMGAKLLPAINKAGNKLAKFLTTKDGKQFEKNVAGGIEKVSDALIRLMDWSVKNKSTLKNIGASVLAGYSISKGIKFINFLGDAKEGLSKLLSASSFLRKTNWTKLFHPVKDAAEEAGATSGKSMMGKLLPVARKGFGKIAGIASVALEAVEVTKGLTSHNAKSHQKAAGRGIGAAIGGGIGAFFGGAPGLALGTTLGGAIGSKIPDTIRHMKKEFSNFSVWWGKQFVPNLKKSWNQFTTGFGNPEGNAGSNKWWTQFGAWFASGKGKTRDKAWQGMSRGWNNFWNGSDSGSKEKKSSKLSATDQKVMSSAMDVSKKSISNVKSMSRALKNYAKNLGTVKSTIKKNDPSKELNSVSSALSRHEKTWARLSKDIKPIGNAFKYLATFAKSMAKVDAFKELTSDLPKLEKALSKSKKGIINGLKDLNKSFGSKKSGIYEKVQSVAKAFDNLDTKIYHLNKKLDDTTKDFKEIGKISKQFSSKKNNPFVNMATGLDKLEKALKADTKKITSYVDKINRSFSNTKVKGQKKSGIISNLKAVNKPLNNIDKSIVSLAKHIKPVTKGFQSINKVASKGALYKIDKSVKNLSKTLKRNKFGEQIAKQIEKANSALKKKRSFVSGLESAFNRLEKDFKNIRKSATSNFSLMQKKINASMKGIYSGVINLAKSTSKGFGKAMSRMKDYAQDAMKDTIEQINHGISGIDKVLSQFGGNGSVIKPVKFATGSNGQLNNNTLAMVNDAQSGPRQEAIVKASGDIWLPHGDNRILPLQKGDAVLNGTQTQDLAHSWGLPHFAKGSGVSHSLLKKIASRGAANPAKSFANMYTSNLKSSGPNIQSGTTDLAKNSSKQFGIPWMNAMWTVIGNAIGDGNGHGGTRESFLKYAEESFSGVRYVMGAASKIASDCSGMVMQALRHFNVDIGRSTVDMQHSSGTEYLGKSLSKTLPGDLVIFGHGTGAAGHIGIIKNPRTGTMFNETPPSARVSRISDDTSMGYGFYRVKGLHDATAKSNNAKPSSRLMSLAKSQLGASALKWIKDKLGDEGSLGGNIGGEGVQRWAGTVKRILGMLNLSTSKPMVEKVLRQIQTESSGNPSAKQAGADPDGDGSGPALGLMQTKRATFNAFKRKGAGNIFNGPDNIYAGLNYAKHKYGSDLSALGNGHGYANGGDPTVGDSVLVGEKGPEIAKFKAPVHVYSHEQSKKLGLDKLLSKVQIKAPKKASSTAPKVTININGNISSESDARKYAEIINQRLEEVFNNIGLEFGGDPSVF